MKKILLGVGVLLLLIGLFFFFTREKTVVIDGMSLPVITVEGNVTLKKETINRLVLSGETVQAPFTLITDTDARAVVTFPDGSELRASENSELVVQKASYTQKDGELIVHAQLTIGRVWSNIVALVTPGSSWEVETSNVVATVRGTAFGMETTGATTTVTGSEHTVELTLVDLKTGERITDQKQPLQEDEFIIIGENAVQGTEQIFPSTQKRNTNTDNDSWITENEIRDGNNNPDTTDTTQTESSDTPIDTKETTILDTAHDTPPAPTQQDIPAPTPKNPQQNEAIRPVSLLITPSVTLTGIIEGTPVTLTGTLTLSDGTKRTVTNEVLFKVLGKIGSIQGNIFMPLLDASVSEYGKAYGSIVGIWKDSVTGITLEGSTAVFDVRPKITIGIQEG